MEVPEDSVLLRVHQRSPKANRAHFEVRSSPEGHTEIPMSVSATTVGSWLPKAVVMRSPWLARCLGAAEGETLTRSVEGSDLESEAGDEDHPATGSSAVVTCCRMSEAVFEIGLPGSGSGQVLLTPKGILQCLDLSVPGAVPADASLVPSSQLFTMFIWAVVLELQAVADLCRDALLQAVDRTTVALALATGWITSDADLLRKCYWCLRQTLCGVPGVPSSWLDTPGPIKLTRGVLSHKTACRTPLRVLAGVVDEDMSAKRERWQTPTDCYTLCRIHRQRQECGAYPHRYELRLDHSDEVLLTAFREDEQSMCRIFEGAAAGPEISEHDEAFLGSVVPNFWGTAFSVYDSGCDKEALLRLAPASADLPVRQRTPLCKIGYETNLLGDCPRKVTFDMDRGGQRYHMENVAPRWDKKLNSYALPFFGRVKKASAKNFQLVVDDNFNTIYLMFGKISKDVFCLDFRGPLAPIDAMAIAIAALAKKRAVS